MGDINEQNAELVRRLQRKAKLILVVGISAGLFVILSAVLSLPVSPELVLGIVIVSGLFVIFQMTHIFLVARKASRQRK